MLKIDTIQQEVLASPDPPVQECCSFISIKSKRISSVIDGFRKDFISFNSEKLRSATGATVAEAVNKMRTAHTVARWYIFIWVFRWADRFAGPLTHAHEHAALLLHLLTN